MLFLSSYFVLLRCGCYKRKSISFPISWNFFVGKYLCILSYFLLVSAVNLSSCPQHFLVASQSLGVWSWASVQCVSMVFDANTENICEYSSFFFFQIIQSDVFGHLHHVLFFGLQLCCSFWDFWAISHSHLHKGQSFFLAPSMTSFFKTSHAPQLFLVPHAEGWSDRTSTDPLYFGWFHRLRLVNARTIFFPLVQYHAQMIFCAACKQSTFTFTSFIMIVATKTCWSIRRLIEPI